jgi:hypothetical protein
MVVVRALLGAEATSNRKPFLYLESSSCVVVVVVFKSLCATLSEILLGLSA